MAPEDETRSAGEDRPADRDRSLAPPDDGDPPTPTETSRPVDSAGARTGHRAAGAVIGVLTLLLGFAIAVQVRANSSSDSLSGLREDDLIGILDNQNARSDRLRAEINDLQANLRSLQDSGNRAAAARTQARQEAKALGVLLGTLPAGGPGVRITITDPAGKLGGEDLLDVVEELRGAGAEAIQFGDVRVSTPTSFGGGGGSVFVDGRTVESPYTILAIGEPKTLDTALNIPGGVAATVRAAGGELTVVERVTVSITVVRSPSPPKYAAPSR